MSLTLLKTNLVLPIISTLFAVESLVMSPCIWMTPGRGAMAWRSTATIFTSSLSSSGR